MTSSALEWFDVSIDELSARQWHDLLYLRIAVFVVEQQCAYAELDGQDVVPGTRHIFATNDSGTVIAYARVLAPVATLPVRVGRVVVRPPHRGTGLSQQLMKKVLHSCALNFPNTDVQLSAQVGVHQFYETFGFVTVSEDYLDDGIWHRDMLLENSAM